MKRISKEKAYGIAIEYIKKMSNDSEIMISRVIDHEKGWLFSYNTKEFIEGDDSHALCGNIPFVVNATTGEVQLDFDSLH